MKKYIYILAGMLIAISHFCFAQSSLVMPDGSTIVTLYGTPCKISSTDTTSIRNDMIFVKYTSSVSDSTISDIETGVTFDSLKIFPTGWRCYYLPQNTDVVITAQKFLALTGVKNVDFNYNLTYFSNSLAPNDPYYGDQWYLDNIQVPDVWADFTTGLNDLKVGVLDKGADWFNSDIGPDNGMGRNFIDNNLNTYPSSVQDYHGNMVTSIIAARTQNETGLAGIAGGWNTNPVSIVMCKVGNGSGPSVGAVVSALDWCLNRGVRIFNFSFGFYGPDCSNISYPLLDEIIYAYQKYDAIMFSSTGDSKREEVAWPACSPYVIAVGGTNENDGIWAESGSPTGSSWGVNTDISAPGTDIIYPLPSMDPNYTQIDYETTNSTSGATAVATGVGALMLSVNPCLSNEDMLSILEETADKTGGYNYNTPSFFPGHSLQLGYGKINAYNAVLKASELTNEITSGQNITFSEPKWFTHDLIVRRGGLLTITSTIKFTEGHKLLVEPGARLIIDGGTLTSTCPTWDGVEVQGEQDLSQSPSSNQGYVHIFNQGSIENAQIGINSRNGGIVLAESASFINNLHSIIIADYPNKSNCSKVGRCCFVWKSIPEKDYLTPNFIGNQYFIGVQNIKPITVSGCTFVNNLNSYVQPFEIRGYGIVCYNGDIIVSEWSPDNSIPVSNGILNQFRNLKYGVFGLTSAGHQNTLSVSGSNFENNLNGIYASGYNNVSYACIFKNKIRTLNYDPTDAQPFQSYCLYLNNCSGYTVDENEFVHNDTYGPAHQGFGLIINQSGPFDNMIYNNTFHGLGYGSIAQNCNRGPIPQDPNISSTGLCYKCNDFYDNINDIVVTTDNYPIGVNQGIATYQGNEDYPADNTFSTNNLTGENFDNSLSPNSPLQYYVPQYIGNNNLDPVRFYGITKQIAYGTTFNKANDCPSSFSNDNTIGDLQSEINGEKETRDSLITVLQNLIDGGNTEQLLDNVALSTTSQAIQVHNDLISKSPYLSDSVMETAVLKEAVLTNSMIRDILVENPQSPKSNQVMAAVDQRNNPMPDSLMVQIETGLDLLGDKEIKEAELSTWSQKYAKSLKSLIHKFNCNEDTTANYCTDSLVGLLNKDNSLDSRYSLVNYYYNRGEYANGNSIFTNIPNAFNLSEKQSAIYHRFDLIFSIAMQIDTSSFGFSGLDSSQIAILFSLAKNDADLPGAYARNLLVMNGMLQYHEPIILPSPQKETRQRHTYVSSQSDVKEDLLKVFPNPAERNFTVEYKIVTNNLVVSDVTISVIDLYGHKLMNYPVTQRADHIIIPTDNLSNGDYLIVLNNKGKSLIHKIITVLK